MDKPNISTMNNTQLQVWKFGGASISNPDLVENVGSIVKNYLKTNAVIVTSAKGKTTNALETLVKAYMNESDEANKILEEIKQDHFQYAQALCGVGHPILNELNDLFVEIEWILEDPVIDPYDYVYDQIVSIGELASTKVVSQYFVDQGIKANWLDIRDVILTDNRHREARVDWEITQKRSNKIKTLLESYDVIVTQGYIASSSENFTTTLGREGSDYTAAILSYCLDADSMHIWKDVPGILTGDPRLFKEVMKIDRLSYKEAVEMTYYGAKVIHEKTIKPLQNKNIPLFVRPFYTPEKDGTLISAEDPIGYPPVIVVNADQVLLHISTNDFSFVGEHHLGDLFTLFAKHRIRVNMMRNTAISFTVCTNNRPGRIKAFEAELGDQYTLQKDSDLKLMTIRHYTEDVVNSFTKGKLVLFQERLKNTVHIVVKELVE
ncbi:aspartate kinase [Saprospiraceae bacterium]|nr:aspartate kinase [Saprospiraceae bacterium]